MIFIESRYAQVIATILINEKISFFKQINKMQKPFLEVSLSYLESSKDFAKVLKFFNILLFAETYNI